MGLTITAKYPDAPAYDMSYMTFWRLRCDIADCISKEFGDHYRKIIDLSDVEIDAFNQETERLKREYKIKNRILDFLFAADCEGMLSPKKCEALYAATEKAHQTRKYCYPGRKCDVQMTMADFRELLRCCGENKKYMVWM